MQYRMVVLYIYVGRFGTLLDGTVYHRIVPYQTARTQTDIQNM